MAIDPASMYHYAAEFTAEGFSHDDIVLKGSYISGGSGKRMVGLKPMIRFWAGKLILAASDADRPSSTVRLVSGPFGDAVRLLAQPGDTFHIASCLTGDTGLCVLRGEELILAIGAITAVPLGNAAHLAKFHETLEPRETCETDGFFFYVEHHWEDGEPGRHECVAVCPANNQKAKIEAMRSAILLAHRLLTVVDWDGKWIS